MCFQHLIIRVNLCISLRPRERSVLFHFSFYRWQFVVQSSIIVEAILSQIFISNPIDFKMGVYMMEIRIFVDYLLDFRRK